MNLNPPRAQAIALPHGGAESVLATNKVIRNTYLLLSLTLAFAAVSTGVSVALKLPHSGILLTLGGFFGLLFATPSTRRRRLLARGSVMFSVYGVTGQVFSGTLEAMGRVQRLARGRSPGTTPRPPRPGAPCATGASTKRRSSTALTIWSASLASATC